MKLSSQRSKRGKKSYGTFIGHNQNKYLHYGNSKGEEKETGRESIFKAIIAKKLPKLKERNGHPDLKASHDPK